MLDLDLSWAFSCTQPHRVQSYLILYLWGLPLTFWLQVEINLSIGSKGQKAQRERCGQVEEDLLAGIEPSPWAALARLP